MAANAISTPTGSIEQAEMMKSLAAVSAEVAKRKPGLEQAFNVFAAVAKRTQQ
jgi:hypothetical protein